MDLKLKKECSHATCEGPTCRREKKQRKIYYLPRQKVAPKKIAPSRRPAQNTYKKRSKIFREENPVCQIKSPVCTGQTQCVHHTKGKIGDLLNDERWWMAGCFACNGFVEDNSEWAYENGKKFSKF